MALAVTVVVFAVIFLVAAIAVIAAWLVLQPREAAPGGAPGAVADLMRTDLIRDDAFSSISLWDAVLDRFDLSDRLRDHLAQAELDTWTVGRLTAFMLLSFAIGLLVFGSISWLPFWLVIPFAGAAGSLPYIWVLRKRRIRLDRFEEQLPDALDLLARSLRTGHPFAVSMEFLARDNAPPISAEFRTTVDEHRLGGSWNDALNHLAERIPRVSVRMFVAAVILQNRTGGKLGEVLTQLSETIRESQALKGEVRALSAHGRVTGLVLTILPLAIAAMMMVVSPGYLSALTSDPTGRILVILSGVSLIAAHLIIRKIVDIRL